MRKAASRGLLATVVLWAAACSSDVGRGPASYSYLGCEDNGAADCPGRQAFTCAMETIATKYGRCNAATDCAAVTGLDPDTCFEQCESAAINQGQNASYLAEVKTEIFKYCTHARCTAYPYCPRPNNAVIDCVDGGYCAWVEGVFKFPDAGDAGGSAAGPDAAVVAPGLDAGQPAAGLDAAAPVAGLDAAAPAGLDAAPPAGLDAAPPPGEDAAAPPGEDAAAPPGQDADLPGQDV